MDLARTVSEMNGDFCRKSQIFPTPCISCPPLREFPLQFFNGGATKKIGSYSYQISFFYFLIIVVCKRIHCFIVSIQPAYYTGVFQFVNLRTGAQHFKFRFLL